MEGTWSVMSSQSSIPATPWEEIQPQLEQTRLDTVSLQDGANTCSINLPYQMASRFRELKESFSPTSSSSLELCLSFMQHIINSMNPESRHDSLDRAILKELLTFVQMDHLHGENIHTVLESEDQGNNTLSMRRTYFQSCTLTKSPCATGNSQLLSGDTEIFALFNGQGVQTYFEELRETYDIYQHHMDSLVHCVSNTLVRLSANDRVKGLFSQGLDVKEWLTVPESCPDVEYLTTASVSFPLVGLSQFVQYAVACINLNLSPGELRRRISGATGHSQGVVVASFIATVDSWDSFNVVAQQAVEILFWIGTRSQRHVHLRMPSQSQSFYMLSVKGLSQQVLQKHLDEINAHLPSSQPVYLALVNGPQQHVIAGFPLSLQALEKKLQIGRQNASQSRIPFSQRKPTIQTRFLPITAPFHSPYLRTTEAQLQQDLSSYTLRGSDLGFPVLDTNTAENLQSCPNLIPRLIQMICTETVEWENVIQTAMAEVTHLLDFGPGGDGGIGSLVNQQKEGTGLRTVIVGATSHQDSPPSLGYSGELYTRILPVRHNAIWREEYAPRLMSTEENRWRVDTKFSRLLGLPPVMVGGMTPTTTAADFVAAIMNAGYHAEIACGGFPNADQMRQGILSLVDLIDPGRGITCNLIYANPRAMAWQVPVLVELRQSGVPITGLTIGAGVPSPEIVQGYITDLSLTHISLKPGSIEAIDAVLEIAEATPDFLIILQWTGGRGGGHHSYEDFHEPLLNRYAQIRAHTNVILVVGSGFGDPEGAYPYLTGSWSQRFNRAPMPVDGILLGSRVMAAKEAHTSPAVKQAICQVPGVPDKEWEDTWNRPAGGIISVRSEMGEPIHKLATRGVMLWAELDRDIFSLPRDKQKEALLARKGYYIQRLNEDFQKVWFGRNAGGQTVELHEMSYGEILHRMIDLLYLRQSGDWIDPSFRVLVWDFIQRLEERLSTTGDEPVIHSIHQLDQPDQVQQLLDVQYPLAKTEILTATDAEYMILLSRRRGQKPVPYIIAFDEDFEYWFKKDSLWQSERIDAVQGQDFGRVCILHGPVAAQYTKTVDEPVKSILDGIHNTHIGWIARDNYSGDMPTAHQVSSPSLSMHSLAYDTQEDGTLIYCLSDAGLALDDWWKVLEELFPAPCCGALFTEKMILQDRTTVMNPVQRLLFTAHERGWNVQVKNTMEPEDMEILIQEVKDKRIVATASIRNDAQTKNVILTLSDQTVSDRPAIPIVFRFEYKPRDAAPSIAEVMTDRNLQIQRFYQTIWLGQKESPSGFHFQGEDVVLTREMIDRFARSIRCTSSSTTLYAPLDLAIAVAWKPMMSSLFTDVVNGDMLRLLHLSNEFRFCEGAEPFKEGDCLSPRGRLTAIRIKKGSGKVIEAEGVIHRNGAPVMHLKSQFILLGVYTDYDSTFDVKEETFHLTLSSNKAIALLKSKRWLFLDENVDLHDYVENDLEFRIHSRSTFQDSDDSFQLSVKGEVIHRSENGSTVSLGSINLSGDSYTKNPVADYLERHGSPDDPPYQPLDHSHTLVQDLRIVIPDAGDEYAQASGDCNPIHLSEMFACYAGHDTRVTHGMFTSAFVRGLVEWHVAHNDPSRMKSWSCIFEGKVAPGDNLSVRIDHIGMSQGRMILAVQVHNTSTGVKVLSAQATVEQPPTAYVFTGQGSQHPGMGMELQASSSTAQQVWQEADDYFERTYGFPITYIVRQNPQELIVYFGGKKGRTIRENYMALTCDFMHENGVVTRKRIFPDITASTRSYTFRSTNGLLHETQFTQPALALTEIARFEDMRAKGVVQEDSLFAGHSLGEYVALTAMGRMFSVERVAALVFYRGLAMQNTVHRDSDGATDYSMCAVNPTRVSKTFTEDDLHWCVAEIARHTSGLLEIVNYNIVNMQYVCAGDLRGLATLTALTDSIASGTLALSQIKQVQTFIQKTLSGLDAQTKPITLQRGRASIPLKVNVPFHSSLLRPGVDSFRHFLAQHIPESMIIPDRLIGKYIPNLTAKPFELSQEYVAAVFELTKSPVLGNLISNWNSLDGVC